MRKRPAQLVNPHNAHTAVTMQLLGIPTGKERTTAENRARLAEPGSDKPKTVTGNIDDGTVFNDLLDVLQARNIIVNKAERGGAFGQTISNAALPNADTPLFLFISQSDSDSPPTTNTATTVAAQATAITLGVGKWAVSVMASMLLAHNASGGVAVSAEIEGMEGSARTYTTGATTGFRVEAHIAKIAEADWIQGEQTLNIRGRYRSNTAGTTTAKNPALYIVAKRMA